MRISIYELSDKTYLIYFGKNFHYYMIQEKNKEKK